MANIRLLGADYQDVPAVTLPGTDGNPVTFYENGGSSAEGEKVLSSAGTYDISSYATVRYEYLYPVRAYINVDNAYWGWYNDTSLSFCFPVRTNVKYTLTWDDQASGLFRLAFTKTLVVPYRNNTTDRKNTYTKDGASGVELASTIADNRVCSFKVTDASLVLCVVQTSGGGPVWTGSIETFKEIISHLTITEEE